MADEKKKKTLFIIGPFPPPIHGESIALQTVYDSANVHDLYRVKKINLNKKNVNEQGIFTFNKFIRDFYQVIKTTILSLFHKKPIIYISISQTKFGLLRDSLIIYLTKLFGCYVVSHLHGNNLGNVIDEVSGVFKRIIAVSLKKIDIGIVLGDKLSSNYRGYVKNIVTVSNGVSETFINKEEIIQIKRGEKPLRILYLSNLMEKKGYVELVKAVVSLLNEGYNLNLSLIGGIHENEKYKEIMSLVTKNNMDDRIVYYGIKSGAEKKQAFLNADIFVLPSKYEIEGQPISIIEAMAAGLPVISTDRGIISELIKDSGLIVKPEVKEISKAIKALYLNDKKRELLSKHARKRYESYYTNNMYITSLLNIFDTLSNMKS